ncbi:MAG TPA: hypothetical protein VNL91_05565 [Thermoanaerobaculia bacterium]|nr:hypothetical protein [Thermoanaerobaculia bacterium]
MKRVLVVAAMAIALMAPVASAGIYYEFQQSTHSDDEHRPSSTFSGKAVIDGNRSRVEFLSGNAYPPGTYVIGQGTRLYTVVDPSTRTFADVNLAAAASSLGAAKVKVENLKWDVKKLPDHPVYAGVPTDHYQMTINYDMTVLMGALPVRQSIQTVIDKWTTVQFGDVGETFLALGGLRTGNPEIDKLIDIETQNIKGFALRQSIVVTASVPLARSASEKTEYPMNLRPVRVKKRDLVITSIREIQPDESTFAVPASYTRAQQRSNVPQTQVEILSLEPAN